MLARGRFVLQAIVHHAISYLRAADIIFRLPWLAVGPAIIRNVNGIFVLECWIDLGQAVGQQTSQSKIRGDPYWW